LFRIIFSIEVNSVVAMVRHWIPPGRCAKE